MKVWLINPYGPLPNEAWRVYCYTLIAHALRDQGHEVIWWTSNFAHHFKKWRSKGWHDLVVTEGFTIRLVPTIGYKKNIGIGRLLRDVIFAFRAYRKGKLESSPDCIITSESPLTFGYSGFKLAQHHKCPIIFHQMDLWPELIIDAFPHFFKPLVRLFFKPIFLSRRKVYSRLDGSSALAASYLNEIFKVNSVLVKKPHDVIYNGIDVQEFRSKMQSGNHSNHSIFPKKQTSDIWAVFAGSLGPSYDLDTLCEAAKFLKDNCDPIKIIIAGDGPRKDFIRSVSNSEQCNLHYVGQLNPDELATLYSLADIGLCAYSSSSNVEMPDKIYDYTAAGLAVLVSLRGEVRDVVHDNRIGFSYEPGSVDDFLSKIKMMTYSPANLAEMKERSWNLGQSYDAKAQYKKMVELVNIVCQVKN